jgi:rhodanese-related sulfurtransferase
LPAVQLVDVERGLELAADTSVVIVDVRTPAEFAEGHLERAVLIDLSAAGFRDGITELDRSATYFVYCQSGNRSGQATAIMAELGFENVFDLDGGILAWQAAGAPVVE